ncbi:hypothetical protein OUZ56_011946 [Daphnia magna]|uniref:Uncharacterized protein n=1 Tax=Daphnia magna TaxID=35525 RepID=A0ABQ9Z1P0_9CRUS|nr:hypothetical protein OUZ56_011946 [Daphnia magna]
MFYVAFTTILIEVLPGEERFPNFNSLPMQLNIILLPGKTRWLSEEACVNRIWEQREALILYFQAESTEDPTAANTLIHTTLNNEMTVPFLEFTSYALNCFDEFITLF